MFLYTDSVPVKGALFGEGSGPVISTSCSTGRELELGECTSNTFPTNCHHGRDAGVVCQGEVWKSCNYNLSSLTLLYTCSCTRTLHSLHDNRSYQWAISHWCHCYSSLFSGPSPSRGSDIHLDNLCTRCISKYN